MQQRHRNSNFDVIIGQTSETTHAGSLADGLIRVSQTGHLSV